MGHSLWNMHMHDIPVGVDTCLTFASQRAYQVFNLSNFMEPQVLKTNTDPASHTPKNCYRTPVSRGSSPIPPKPHLPLKACPECVHSSNP